MGFASDPEAPAEHAVGLVFPGRATINLLQRPSRTPDPDALDTRTADTSTNLDDNFIISANTALAGPGTWLNKVMAPLPAGGTSGKKGKKGKKAKRVGNRIVNVLKSVVPDLRAAVSDGELTQSDLEEWAAQNPPSRSAERVRGLLRGNTGSGQVARTVEGRTSSIPWWLWLLLAIAILLIIIAVAKRRG